MKRSLFLFALGLILVSCGKQNEKDVNASKLEDKIVQVIHAKTEAFELIDTLERADVVAEVMIQEKVEEITEDALPYTVFRAKVVDSYVGNAIGEMITVKQLGISDTVVNDFQLFETGDQYIFFLKETKSSKSDYWILGEETGYFKVINSKTIVKLRHSIPEFEDIEVDHVSSSMALTSYLKNAIDEQVINKQKFINKIISQR